MESKQTQRPISFEELKELTFAPGDIFWKRKRDRVRLVHRGDVLNHDYFEKFKGLDNGRPLWVEDILERHSTFNFLSEGLEDLLCAKHANTRASIQEKLTYDLSQVLWFSTHSLSSLELMEAFHQKLGDFSREEEQQMRNVCHQLFSQTSLKAALSCTLAIILGYAHGGFLKELYRAHFFFYFDSMESYSKELREALTGKVKEQDIFKNALSESIENFGKRGEDFKFPLVVLAMKKVLMRLFDEQDLRETAWTNFSDLEEILLFVQKVFYEDESSLEAMKMIVLKGELVFSNKNLDGLIKKLIHEYKTNFDSVNPRFFHLLSRRMEEAIDPRGEELLLARGA